MPEPCLSKEEDNPKLSLITTAFQNVNFQDSSVVPSYLPSYQLSLICHICAGIAVGIHEQLGVGMNRDERLKVAMALDQIHDILHLNLRVSKGTVIGIRAGACTGTGTCTEELSVTEKDGMHCRKIRKCMDRYT